MNCLRPTRVAVLAFNNISLFHLSVPGLVLGSDRRASGLPLHEVHYVAIEPGTIRTADGLELQVRHGLSTLGRADLVVIPSWADPTQSAPAALTKALRRAHQRGVPVIGLCLGAFVLGDAGLLDDRPATTHWAWRELFAQRFPRTKFRPDVLYVDEGNVITSAGTVAAIDCCLNLVRERHGADVANRIARRLVTPPYRQGGQAQYVEQPVPVLASETRLPEVMDWVRAHLAQPLNLDALAARAHMSRRTFTRRFREATGTTVGKWLISERLQRAQQLLETTALPIERVATEAGFGSAMSLRQHFLANNASSPSAYRRMFRNGRASADGQFMPNLGQGLESLLI